MKVCKAADTFSRLWLCCIVAEHPPFLHLPSTRALLSTLSLESDDFLRDCLVHGLHSLELSLFSHQSSFSQSHLGPFFGSRILGNWRRKQVVGLSLIAVCPPVAPIVRVTHASSIVLHLLNGGGVACFLLCAGSNLNRLQCTWYLRSVFLCA